MQPHRGTLARHAKYSQATQTTVTAAVPHRIQQVHTDACGASWMAVQTQKMFPAAHTVKTSQLPMRSGHVLLRNAAAETACRVANIVACPTKSHARSLLVPETYLRRSQCADQA